MPGLSLRAEYRVATELRMQQIERWLAAGETHATIKRRLRAEGLSVSQSKRYLSHVYKRFAREAKVTDREGQRERLRAMALDVFQAARTRTRAVVVASAEGASRVERVDDPDARGCTDTLKFLAALDGIIAPNGGAVVNVDNRTLNVGNDAIAHLRALYFGSAPNAAAMPPGNSQAVRLPAQATHVAVEAEIVSQAPLDALPVKS